MKDVAVDHVLFRTVKVRVSKGRAEEKKMYESLAESASHE